MKFKSISTILLLTATAVPAIAGPIGYAICQTGCNGIAVACYSAAGFTFGVAPPAAPPAIIACNTALGACMAACAVVAFGPTP
ncbi:uncharacterized protein HD556DRAFT_1269841 [Suillus plorans]|uniref:Zygote-specific protein n=1 Tax=Suillus plorans TaxID=116603 RepID=A0A9P7ATQ3_9AGAM|nr:uncharacterized protein HD556DRAFT_1269841 [Suillus plorans]KAG1794914.1 hypothetical protein HD556DRAFT_1269841 [Suillus plorans]